MTRCDWCGRDVPLVCAQDGCEFCPDCAPARYKAAKAIRRLAANGRRMRKRFRTEQGRRERSQPWRDW